jgi:hypothetical protein
LSAAEVLIVQESPTAAAETPPSKTDAAAGAAATPAAKTNAAATLKNPALTKPIDPTIPQPTRRRASNT